MAQATITVSDNDDDTVSITCDFEPEVKMAGEATAAQLMAFRVMKALSTDPDRIPPEDDFDDEE